MSPPWKTENWNVSPYNFDDEVRSPNVPEKVEIHDTTLREGEQMAGVVFRSEEKLKIAFALSDLGIRHMEVALLTTGEHGPEALKAVAEVTGGKYFRAYNTKELAGIYHEIDKIEPLEQVKHHFRPNEEMYFWPLLFALILSICGFIWISAYFGIKR